MSEEKIEDDERRPRRIVRGWEGQREYTGLGRTAAQERVKAGLLKPPMKIGPRCVGWWEDDLVEYQQRLIEQNKDRAK